MSMLPNLGSIASGIFGDKTSGKSSSNQTQGWDFQAQDAAALRAQQDQYARNAQGQQSLLGRLGQQSAAGGPLQLQTTGMLPTFNNSPDAITRGLASQATQGMAQQAAAQKAAVAKQFQAQPGAGGILQRQIDMRNRLNANPALFQAFQQQNQRELGQYGANQQGQQAQNNALLQQLQAQQGQRQEQQGFGAAGLGIDQNSMSMLADLAKLFGKQTVSGDTKSEQRSGGILGSLGI